MVSFIVGVILAAEGVYLAGCVAAILLFRRQVKWATALLLGMTVFFVLSPHGDQNAQTGWKMLREQAEAFFDAQGGASFAMLKRVLMGADVKGTFALQQDMRTLGLAHLLAASGLHVQLLFSWGMAILSWSPLSRKQIACILLALLFGYAAFLAFPASILRAWLFLAFREGAIARKRELDATKGWLLALSLILLVMPYRVKDLGLRLSFLCAAAGEFVHAGERIHSRGGMLRRSFRRSFWISLFTFPILAEAGITQTPSTLLANLFAIPAFSLLFALGLLALFGSLLPLPFLSEALITVYRLGYGVFALLLKGLDAIALPGMSISFSTEGLTLYVLVVFLLLAAQLGWLTRFKARMKREDVYGELVWRTRGQLLYLLSLWLLLTVLRPMLLFPFFPPSVEALDVGQGDCFLIRYGTNAVLVDTGGKKDFRTGKNTQAKKVVSMLRERGVRRVERIFLSHDDYDHDGNLLGIRKRIPVDEVVTSPAVGDHAFLDERIGSSHRQAESGDRWTLKNNLLPWAKPLVFTAFQAGQWDAEDKNNHCLVLYLDFGGGVLFMGDQEKEEGLAQILPSDIALLKVAHHGSKRGTSDALLSRVRPEQAIISCGRNNRYGHPAPSTLKRLQQHGVFLHRTDQEGALCYRENPFPWGKRLIVQTEKQQRTTALLLEMLWGVPLIVAIEMVKKEDPLQNQAAAVGKKYREQGRC